MARPLLLALISLIFLTAGCAETQIKEPPIKEPESRTFIDGYENVWRALQLALRRYPVHVNNIDSGIMETEFTNGDKMFSDPSEVRPRPGTRSKLTIRVVKGKLEGKSAVKIVVTKTSEFQPDFFAGFQGLPSNGLEELTILYRIGRYLEMERALVKQSGNSSAPK